MKVLIVSYGDDMHKNHVMSRAEYMGISTLVFDAGSYPNKSDFITINYDAVGEVTLSLGGHTVCGSEISGIWWRRPRSSDLHKLTPLQQYMRIEGEVVIRSLQDLIVDTTWVSDPEATLMAGRKPVQLSVAKSIGFSIPETCISNDISSVMEFISKSDRPLIIKPVGTSFIKLSNEKQPESRNMIVFTRIVDKMVLRENLALVSNCPIIFQEAVKKDSDIRVTVVGNRVFAAEITLVGCSDSTNVDWRHYDGKRIYKRHVLDHETEKMCIALTQRLGLRFGYIDMAFSKKGGYTFFEINPQGQWLPSEIEQLGYPISAALLDVLLHGRQPAFK